jgi:hypothetical protein
MWSACVNDLRQIVERSPADADTKAELMRFLALASFRPSWFDEHAEWQPKWDKP